MCEKLFFFFGFVLFFSEMDLRGTGTGSVLGLQQSMTSSHTSVFISEKGLSLFRELHGVASRFVKRFAAWQTAATILKATAFYEVLQCISPTALYSTVCLDRQHSRGKKNALRALSTYTSQKVFVQYHHTAVT